MLITERGYCHHYFQWIVPGGIGDHGVHVLRHVVRAPSLVQGQKLGHIMVDVPAQDLQSPHNYATQIAAQVRKKFRTRF